MLLALTIINNNKKEKGRVLQALISFTKARIDPREARSRSFTTTFRFAVSNTISALACSAFSKSRHAKITRPPAQCQSIIFNNTWTPFNTRENYGSHWKQIMKHTGTVSKEWPWKSFSEVVWTIHGLPCVFGYHLGLTLFGCYLPSVVEVFHTIIQHTSRNVQTP